MYNIQTIFILTTVLFYIVFFFIYLRVKLLPIDFVINENIVNEYIIRNFPNSYSSKLIRYSGAKFMIINDWLIYVDKFGIERCSVFCNIKNLTDSTNKYFILHSLQKIEQDIKEYWSSTHV
jgi:hypothetical protein